MVLYRTLALLRKDFIWASTNKSQLVFANFLFFIVFLIFLSINLVFFTIDLFKPQVQEFDSLISLFKRVLIYINASSIGINLGADLISTEKIKGTLLSLLTTPLKYYEFVLAKLIFSFSFSFLSSLILVLIDLFMIKDASYSVSNFSSLPFVVLNIAFCSGFFCLIGCCIGLFARTAIDLKQIIIFIVFFLYFMPINVTFSDLDNTTLYGSEKIPFFFDPAFHFLQVFNAKDLSIILIHTAFNALYFFSFFVFNYFYLRFYFSNSKEKRFSLNLFFGLAGVISLFVLSGFISPHFV